MNPLPLEWMGKARADLETAAREGQVRDSPNYDAVCFHCQQAVEKALKAVLVDRNQRPPKTHDLQLLLNAAARIFPELDKHEAVCAALTAYAVEYRYPGEEATEGMSCEALGAAQTIFDEIQYLINKP